MRENRRNGDGMLLHGMRRREIGQALNEKREQLLIGLYIALNNNNNLYLNYVYELTIYPIKLYIYIQSNNFSLKR